MVDFAEKTDRVNEALARLKQQFKNSDNIKHLVTIFTTEAASLEPVFGDVFDMVSVDTAADAQLDVWGQILNVNRVGQTDSVYRTRIKAAIFRYVSSGKWEEIIQGFSILTNPTYVQAEEIFPAAVSLTAVGVVDPSAINAAEVVNALRQLKPAGVRFTAVIVTSTTPFVFFGDPDPTGLGFGDRFDPLVGGNYADRLTI